jgi:hypothetical protein
MPHQHHTVSHNITPMPYQFHTMTHIIAPYHTSTAPVTHHSLQTTTQVTPDATPLQAPPYFILHPVTSLQNLNTYFVQIPTHIKYHTHIKHPPHTLHTHQTITPTHRAPHNLIHTNAGSPVSNHVLQYIHWTMNSKKTDRS